MDFINDDFPYIMDDFSQEIILAEDAPLYVFRFVGSTEYGCLVGMIGGYDFWEDALYRIKQEWRADKKKAETEGKEWDRAACLHTCLIYIRESDVFVMTDPKGKIHAIKAANFLRNKVASNVSEYPEFIE